MKRIETAVMIQRPINQVFDYVIEPANLPDWAPGFLEAMTTSEGPITVGSTSTRVTNFGGRQSESKHVVTEFEPSAVMAVSTKSGPLKIKEIFAFEATNGGTRVTVAEEVTAPLLLKPAEWVFALMAGRNIEKYGQALKDNLESSS